MIGDHIRLRRLGLKMTQRDVAKEIGVDTTCIFNWESDKSKPEIRYMPAIVAFLGYNPLPAATTLADHLATFPLKILKGIFYAARGPEL